MVVELIWSKLKMQVQAYYDRRHEGVYGLQQSVLEMSWKRRYRSNNSFGTVRRIRERF